MIYNAGENKTKIDFLVMGKNHSKYLKNVIVIPELQHGLIVADVDRKKLSGHVTRNKVLQRRL